MDDIDVVPDDVNDVEPVFDTLVDPDVEADEVPDVVAVDVLEDDIVDVTELVAVLVAVLTLQPKYVPAK